MADKMVWQEQPSQKVAADGEFTLYSDRVPPGYIGCATVIAARGNDGIPNENTFLGVEVNGVKHKLKHAFTNAPDQVATFTGEAYLKEGDRVFAEWEAANNGETLVLTVNGILERC